MIDELMDVLGVEEQGRFAEIDDYFFVRVKQYIDELRAKKRQAKTPEEEAKIDDEIRTVKTLVRKIFERRFSRLVRLAISATLGYDEEIKGHLISSEKEFYNKIYDIMVSFREELIG